MSIERSSPAADDDGSVFLSTLKAGGLAGIGGIFFGGTVGILRSNTPVLWAAATTIQWALLGGTVWGIRGAVLKTRLPDERGDPATKAYATAIGGGLGFPIVGALTRGRKNVIPGAIMGTILGYIGQTAYNFFDARHTASVSSRIPHAPSPSSPASRVTRQRPEQRPLLQRIGESKWSPFSVLTDEEYEDMLKKKLLRIEAEIAIIDEDLTKLGAKDLSTAKAHDESQNGDEDARNIEQLDLARRLRDPAAESVGTREDQADRGQVEMAQRLRDRLKRREG